MNAAKFRRRTRKMKSRSQQHPVRGNASTHPDERTGEIPDPLFFYFPGKKWGHFCQWFPSTFTVTKGEIARLVETDKPKSQAESDESITFNCAEQFMMYCKAARFRDTDRQARILATDDPRQQKALAKETIGFWDEFWDPIKSEVVTAGNIAKFGQDEILKQSLLSTGDSLLVEASAEDRVWGIGYTEKNAMSHQEDWGENRLGKALMAAREHLRKEASAGVSATESIMDGD